GLSIHCAQAGVDGLLIPDLSLDNFAVVAPICSAAGVDPVPVIAPSVGDIALSQLLLATGFVYCPVFVFSELAGADLKARVLDSTGLPLVIGVDDFLLETVPGGGKLGDGVLVRSGLSEIILSHPEYEIMLEVSDHVRLIQESIAKAGW
ncbi:MAG: tryptophan synthase subunit alpha, partial [Chloroflexia bacterium]